MADRPIKILIVEDEMIIGAKISLFLAELGYEVTGLISRSEEALHHIQANPPNIILLDIQLKGKVDGIELAAVVQRDYQIPVIFLTANSDDATFQRARKVKPYAFLAKPFKRIDLERTLALAVNQIADSANNQPDNSEPLETSILSDRIFVLHQDQKVKVMLNTILYIEAERNYCRIVTTTSSYLLTMPMKSLESVLPKSSFQRIHRSHIVNLTHVNKVDEDTIVVDDKMLGLSKSYRKEFLRRINAI